MRLRVLVLLAAAVLAVQGFGCCRCCRCFDRRDSRLPPQDVPRDLPSEDRIPPAGLRSGGAPAALPKSDGPAKPTGAYGGS